MDVSRIFEMMGIGSNITVQDTVVKYTNKSFLLSQHAAILEKRQKNIPPGFVTFRQSSSVSTPPGLGKAVELIPENRVDIKILTENVDKVLQGRFFLCRTIAPPYKYTSIMTVVEDPEGQQAVHLALYNYSNSDPYDMKNLLNDLPVGQILAINNPWFKLTSSGGYSVRSDNPADVVVITQSYFEEIFGQLKWKGEILQKYQHLVKGPPQGAMEWKNEGNQLFVNQKYQKAIEYYTESLKCNNDSITLTQVKIDILANRAAAYLNLSCYHKALEDCDRVLEIQPNHEKAIYRKGKCIYNLGRYWETISFLNEHTKKLDDNFNKCIDDLITKAKLLMEQQANCHYDIFRLHKMGSIYHQDIADFTGPIKIQNIPGKGRGMIATEEIQPGQLILVSKAFALVFDEKDNIEFNINMKTKYFLLIHTVYLSRKLQRN